MTTIEAPNSEAFAQALQGNPRRQRKEALVRWTMFAAAAVSILVSALIVVSLASESWTFFTQVDYGNLWTFGWFPRRGAYDVRTIFVASLIVTAVAMVVAAPLGMAAAIYLSEYAKPKARKVLKPAIEVLAGIPSVVLGYFALAFISPNVVQRLTDARPQSLLAAGIGVGILVIPLVASVSEDAMSSVPSALREASSGLGARKVTTTIKVVIPAATSGLVAAFILAVSRALGETMVVFIAGGGGDGALYTANPAEPGITMTAAMASVASGTDSVVGEGLTFQSLYAVGAMLFVFTLALNLVADRFVRRVREVY